MLKTWFCGVDQSVSFSQLRLPGFAGGSFWKGISSSLAFWSAKMKSGNAISAKQAAVDFKVFVTTSRRETKLFGMKHSSGNSGLFVSVAELNATPAFKCWLRVNQCFTRAAHYARFCFFIATKASNAGLHRKRKQAE